MAGATTRDDGDFRGRGCIRAAKDDLVLRVEGEGRVCTSERVQSCKDEFVGIGEEMFGWSERCQHPFRRCLHFFLNTVMENERFQTRRLTYSAS